MKRLHVYVIKSFLGPFFMTFFIVVFVLLMQFLWRYVGDLVGKGLDISVLAEMLFYASFGVLPYAFPLAMLLASIMTFGSLGENYELVAMKSAGISLFRIMRPLIFIAALIAIVAFYFSNNILPKTNLKFTTLMVSVRQQRPELVLQEGVFTNGIDGYNIKVGRKDKKTNVLYDLLIYDHTQNKSNESVTVADSGYLKITEDKQYMVLNLYSGVNYSEQAAERKDINNRPFRRDKFDEQTIRVKVNNFDFNRRDEGIYKNMYRMLNIKQLDLMLDTLNEKYYDQVRNYLLQININPTISRHVFNLTVQYELIILRVSGISLAGITLTLLKIGLVFTLITFLVGELITPLSEKMAQRMRIKATDSVIIQDFKSGLWVKDGDSFVNVEEILPDSTLLNVHIYEFDQEFRLKTNSDAKSGKFDGVQWNLKEVTQIHLDKDTNYVKQLETATWHSLIRPELLNVLLVLPEKMSAWNLYSYIQHLSVNKQKTTRYEMALWSKLVYPLACMVMIMLALPFGFIQQRATGASTKIFIGIMLGVLYQILNRTFVYLGVLNDWAPLFSAITPTVLFLMAGLGMLHYVDRK